MRRALASVCALLASLALAAGARADVFAPISLLSVSSAEQADSAEQSVVSGDGRYVAFRGNFAGVEGIWRRDLASGAIEAVVVGASRTPDAESALPSISPDGRYVSFTTTARLDEANDHNVGPDVYVRDMSLPVVSDPNSRSCPESGGGPCAYTLASAANNSTRGLSYKTEPGREKSFGALASGRSALAITPSGQREVAFMTTATSNLANPAGGPEALETPPLQVAVRNLDTHETRLVTAMYEPASGHPALVEGRDVPVPMAASGVHGAVYVEGSIPEFIANRDPSVGASISADGSTVAWTGQQVAEQARVMLPEESAANYTEPLWRRVADGPLAPTRRVTGGSDPQSPACAASGEAAPALPATLSDPCQGPFEVFEHGGVAAGILPPAGAMYLPQLSGDGGTVAFLSRTPLVGLQALSAEGSDDLYVANMADDTLTRVQALRRLTEITGPNVGFSEPILSLGVSPDGSEIAFSTARTVFPLGSPAYVSPPLASSTGQEGAEEVYDVDLADDTLTRVTQGFNGAATEAPNVVAQARVSASPSFSADGDLLVFSSEATNLVYADGNRAPDVFAAGRIHFLAQSTQQYISPRPAAQAGEPAWLLSVSARARRDGSVLLEAYVPGAGALRASARAAVLTTSTVRSRARARGGSRGKTTAVSTRTVASAGRASGGEGPLALALALARSYRPLAFTRGGLSAIVDVSFAAPDRETIHQRIAVTFVGVAHKGHAKGKRGGVANRHGAARKGARR